MRVAIVHDWLTGMRGGERVLEELCALYPEAVIFTLIHRKGSVSPRIESMPIRVSPLNRIKAFRERYRDLLPLYPWAVSRFDLRGFDLILSNSHAFAKGVRKPEGSLHICSCLTPMRYVWDMGAHYFRSANRFDPRRAALGLLKRPLRAWDRATAGGVDCFLADSRHVQQRIERYYGRRAEVVYPPVNTGFFTPNGAAGGADYYLAVSALVPYKRVDLAVEAFSRSGRKLVVVGDGPERRKLEAMAGRSVEFRGFVADSELLGLYRHCRAVVVAGLEDFGLVALEAQACGRPAIAYGAGGALETVLDGETGVLFETQTPECLEQAVRRLESTRFGAAVLRAQAERFSAERFRGRVGDFVRQQWDEFAGSGRRHAHAPEAASAARVELAQPSAPEMRHPAVHGLTGAAKRALDVAFSAIGLALLGPLLLLLAWRIRATSAGPALYRQRRLGLRGREFTMVKLRTMRADAEKGRGAIWPANDDPRCTPLGSWLRRYGVDELPQLWNVLRGDMSLVGPRPERPEFHAIFARRHRGFERRLSVRGGITGLAQVRGWRGDTSITGRYRSDLEYVDAWTLRRDFAILLQTPFRLLWGGRHGRPSIAGLRQESEKCPGY